MVPRRIGRYVIANELARGGMATVHLGRLVADRGFSRLVAIKMLGRDQGSTFHRRALEDEARIASRIRHPNVVQPLDVLESGGDLFVVMEYVHGVSLSQLFSAARTSSPLAPSIIAAILLDVLKGLHAAHEALDEKGRPLGIVHRDVSPQNILVGADGVARLADFGVAKVMRRQEKTMTGTVKGKPSYMPPEQLRGLPLTRQADLYAMGVVLAEGLSGVAPRAPDDDPLDWRDDALALIKDRALAEIAVTATREDPRDRYATAAEMSAALAAAIAPARAEEVADRVTMLAGDEIDERAELVRAVEALEVAVSEPPPPPSAPPLPSAPFTISHPPSAPPPPPERRTHGALPIFVGACGVALFLAGLWAWTRTEEHRPSPPPPAVATPESPPTSAPPPPPPVETETAPAPPPTIVVSTTTVAPAPTAHTTKTTTHTAKAAGRPPARNCDPPFFIDDKGVKHYKPECGDKK